MITFLCVSFMTNYVCLYSSICWTIYQIIFMYTNFSGSLYNHYGWFELDHEFVPTIGINMCDCYICLFPQDSLFLWIELTVNFKLG